MIKKQQADIANLKKAWQLRWNEISLDKKIGKGAAGDVWRGTLRGKMPVVVKLISDEDADISNDKEINFLMRARHPRLILFMGCGTRKASDDVPSQVFLVLESMEGSLDSMLWVDRRRGRDPPTWQTRLQVTRDVAEGMQYLHCTMNSIHRDLKSPNVLVSHEEGGLLRAKVADFGLAKIIKREKIIAQAALQRKQLRESRPKSSRVEALSRPRANSSLAKITSSARRLLSPRRLGSRRNEEELVEEKLFQSVELNTGKTGTPLWMAPELCKKGGIQCLSEDYTRAVDVYAFGMVMWEIAELARPWSRQNFKFSYELLDKVVAGARPTVSPPSKSNAPAGYLKLMRHCWSQSPGKRPDFPEIIKILRRLHVYVIDSMDDEDVLLEIAALRSEIYGDRGKSGGQVESTDARGSKNRKHLTEEEVEIRQLREKLSNFDNVRGEEARMLHVSVLHDENQMTDSSSVASSRDGPPDTYSDETFEDSDSSTSDVELERLREEVKLWEKARQRAYGNDRSRSTKSEREDDDSEVEAFSEESGEDDVEILEQGQSEESLSMTQKLHNEIEAERNKLNELQTVLTKMRAIASEVDDDGCLDEKTTSENGDKPRGRFVTNFRDRVDLSRSQGKSPQKNDDSTTPDSSNCENGAGSMDSWRKLGLMPWSSRKDRREHIERTVQKDYGRYFKMLERGDDPRTVRIRMEKKFIGSNIVDMVLTLGAKRRRIKEETDDDVALSITKADDTYARSSLPAIERTQRQKDVEASIAEALLAWTSTFDDNAVDDTNASTAAAFAAAVSVACLVSTEETLTISKSAVASARSEQTRLKAVERKSLLRQIQQARKEERERRSRCFKGIPLHERKLRSRRKRNASRIAALKKRMQEAETRERDAEIVAEAALRKRTKARMKRVQSLVDRDERSRAVVQAKIDAIEARKEKKRQEDRELRSFWKSLIRGKAP
eukprot:g1273.t1